MSEHKHENGVCHCKSTVAAQSLTEMDFDRGIWSAALYNDIGRLKDLISRGHTNHLDETGYTALHYAARKNNITACELLIRADADVNAKTNGGVTPLHRAAMMGHIDVVKLLLIHRADAKIQDSDGNTAAHRAGQNGHHAVLHLLLQSDESLVNCLNNRGQTPLNITKS
ncbi:Ankyrin repeat domain-containing protein 39 [Pseudolycoriella hygida]|uniref:Ankyrin repeat domain-containing protein 39 n=1 Tax=Pseudolycoriella hygida TaxID=35572 RepID=A0A9Q0NEL9_9DIPT|nr:Ankyrin repeat domain-containing protein 39 [Pseudolycoriella hygida]